jgi:hypothetical protein
MLQAQSRASYLIRSLLRCETDLVELQSLAATPLPLLPADYNTAVITRTTSALPSVLASHLPLHFLDTQGAQSEMHSLGSFLDVSKDDTFSSDKFQWLSKAAYASSYAASSASS